MWYVVIRELAKILQSEKSRSKLDEDPRPVLWKNYVRVGLSVGSLSGPFSCTRGTHKNDVHVGFPPLHPVHTHPSL